MCGQARMRSNREGRALSSLDALVRSPEAVSGECIDLLSEIQAPRSRVAGGVKG